MKKRHFLYLGLAAAALLLCLFVSCEPLAADTVPTEGVWRCEELRLIWNWDEGYSLKIDGEHVTVCGIDNERYSTVITNMCQEFSDSKYQLGEIVFEGSCVSLEGETLVVSEYNTETLYYFERIYDSSYSANASAAYPLAHFDGISAGKSTINDVAAIAPLWDNLYFTASGTVSEFPCENGKWIRIHYYATRRHGLELIVESIKVIDESERG